jgi:hypothetical protein
MHKGTYHNFTASLKRFSGLVCGKTTKRKATLAYTNNFQTTLFLCNNFIYTVLHAVPSAVPLQIAVSYSVTTPLLEAFA